MTLKISTFFFLVILLYITKLDFLIFSQSVFVATAFLLVTGSKKFKNIDLLNIILVFWLPLIFISSYASYIYSDFYYRHAKKLTHIEPYIFLFIEFFILIVLYKLFQAIKFQIQINKRLFIFLYLLFVIWILLLRPLGIIPFSPYEHDIYNFYRLFFNFPSVILIFILYPALFYTADDKEIFIMNVFFILLCMFLIISAHSPHSVWWSRRFIVSGIFCLIIMLSLFFKYQKSFSLITIRLVNLILILVFAFHMFLYFFNFVHPGSINSGHKNSFKSLLAFLENNQCNQILFVYDGKKYTETLGQSISSHKSFNVITNFNENDINKTPYNQYCVISAFKLDETSVKNFKSPFTFKLKAYTRLPIIVFRNFFSIELIRKKIGINKIRNYHIYLPNNLNTSQ